MDPHTAAALLGAAGGLTSAFRHRRAAPRAWTAHLLMATAMAAMAVPRLTLANPALWTAILGLAAAWTLGRPGAETGHPALALDLYAMAALSLLTLAATGHHGTSTAWGRYLYVTVLATWALARTALTHRAHGHHTKPNPTEQACIATIFASLAFMAT